MKRKTTVRLLVGLALVGSFITFYGTNLVLSDVSNMFYSPPTKDWISSMPIFIVSVDFVLASIAVMRLYSRPQYKKREALLYTALFAIFSAVGLLMTILSGTVIYGSFAVPYPFRGAFPLSFLWHGAGLITGIVLHGKAGRLPEDPARRKIRVSYVFFTVFLSVLTFFAYNRFGAFLWMPVYCQWRTFGITFPFYLSLLLPMALLGHMVFYIFAPAGEEEKANAFRFQLSVNARKTIVYLLTVLIADLVLALWVGIVGSRNTQFVSAISPAVAIERLATMPIDTIVHFTLVFVLDIYSLVHAIRVEKVRRKAQG